MTLSRGTDTEKSMDEVRLNLPDVLVLDHDEAVFLPLGAHQRTEPRLLRESETTKILTASQTLSDKTMTSASNFDKKFVTSPSISKHVNMVICDQHHRCFGIDDMFQNHSLR